MCIFYRGEEPLRESDGGGGGGGGGRLIHFRSYFSKFLSAVGLVFKFLSILGLKCFQTVLLYSVTTKKMSKIMIFLEGCFVICNRMQVLKRSS